MLQDFKKFLLRGNVVDLAVGVVIGGAFTAVVTGLVNALINPLISLFAGQHDYTRISFHLGKAVFPIGLFITPLISFLLIATVIFFFVVLPINKLTAAARRREGVSQKSDVSVEAAMLAELKQIREALAKK